MRFPEDVPTLGEGHVVLRAPRPEDARGSWEQGQDPESVRFTSVPVPYTQADSREYVEQIIPAGWREDRDYTFVVDALHTDAGVAEGSAGSSAGTRYAGSVGLRPLGGARAEIAYGAHPWARGRGVMEAALRLLLDWGFVDLGLHTVLWQSDRGNLTSRRLAWRLGFDVSGSLRSWLPKRGALHDAWVGTLVATDERAPRHRWLETPTIRGEGVVLRWYAAGDAQRIVEACSDRRTAYWLDGLPRPYRHADAEAYLLSRAEALAGGTAVHWAVADPASGRLLGNLGVLDVGGPGGSAEIGYWTHPDARGRGVMSEALRLAVRHCLVPEEDGGLGLHRVRVRAGEHNVASRHVIEQAGFVPTGVRRQDTRTGDGGRQDTVTYDVLATELTRPPG